MITEAFSRLDQTMQGLTYVSLFVFALIVMAFGIVGMIRFLQTPTPPATWLVHLILSILSVWCIWAGVQLSFWTMKSFFRLF